MDFELQFLKSGKALCGKAFPRFVATWNWLVNFCSNLKGDADVNDAQGKITVDRADPAHPIIRCSGCSGGSSSGDSSSGGGLDSITGTDGVAVSGVKTLTFKTADDANVEVKLTVDADGNATATIGVYYL